MFQVTERWTGWRYTSGESGQRVFDVIWMGGGVAPDDGEAALQAPGMPGGNDTHPLDGDLVVDKRSIEKSGPAGHWLATIPYVRTDLKAGEAPGGGGQPPKAQWSNGSVNIQVDVDYDGSPLCNSALDPFDPAPSRDVPFRILTVSRYEPFYDPGLADMFENTKNAGPVTLPKSNGRVVPPGRMLLKSYLCPHEYDARTTIFRNQWIFEVYPDEVYLKWRFLDQGRAAMYAGDNGPVRGELFDRKGVQVSVDQRLNGDGTPFDSGHVQITKFDETPQVIGNPKGSTLDKRSGKAVFLLWPKFPSMDFSQFGIF